MIFKFLINEIKFAITVNNKIDKVNIFLSIILGIILTIFNQFNIIFSSKINELIYAFQNRKHANFPRLSLFNHRFQCFFKFLVIYGIFLTSF